MYLIIVRDDNPQNFVHLETSFLQGVSENWKYNTFRSRGVTIGPFFYGGGGGSDLSIIIRMQSPKLNKPTVIVVTVFLVDTFMYVPVWK